MARLQAAASAADHVFCDLEDAVAPMAKPGARKTIVEALNGREALDWLDEGEDVGLVLTDVVMSGQPDGLGLAQQILQKRDRLPVIVCSGLDAHSFQEAVRDPQRCAVVGKPYALAEMARTIRRLLDAQEVS